LPGRSNSDPCLTRQRCDRPETQLDKEIRDKPSRRTAPTRSTPGLIHFSYATDQARLLGHKIGPVHLTTLTRPTDIPTRIPIPRTTLLREPYPRRSSGRASASRRTHATRCSIVGAQEAADDIGPKAHIAVSIGAGARPFLRRAYEFLCGASSNNSVTRHSRVGDVDSRRSCGRTDEEIAGFTSEAGCRRHDEVLWQGVERTEGG
jgi:hypothetical protein